MCHVGHQHPKVVKAVQDQVGTLNTNSRYLHPNAALLAKRLSDLLPDPLSKVYFCNSGSEANDLALRLARAYSKSKNVIVVDNAYHGHTLAVLDVSPYKFDHSKEFELIAHQKGNASMYTPGEHIWKVPCPDTYRGLHRGEDAGEKYADYVKEACRVYREERKQNVGAFIIEGGMSIAGVILPPPKYLEICIKHVRSAGGLYIADEVQTGFGRLGSHYWAFQHNNGGGQSVVPDIVTVGKPFGNGMPLAAVITTKEVAESFQAMGVELFNTFGGNPVSAAAGLEVLNVIESEALDHNAVVVGGYLKDEFEKLKHKLDIIGDIRGSGLFLGIELVRDHFTLEPATNETSVLCTTLKEKYRILTSIDGPHNNVLVLKPPMVFSKENVDELISCFESAVTNDLCDVDCDQAPSKTPT